MPAALSIRQSTKIFDAAVAASFGELAVGAMSRLGESAQKITEIITVIDEIALRTSPLVLNTADQAARAGEATQEIRQLAQRSSQAASDFKKLIQGGNRQVRDVVQLVNQAGEPLNELVGSTGEVRGGVGEIANASHEQAAGVQLISKPMTTMGEMTQQNSALIEESAVAARASSDQTGWLSELMNFFKLGWQPASASSGRETQTCAGSRQLEPVLSGCCRGFVAANLSAM